MEIFCIYSDESFKQCIRLKDKAFKNCKCDVSMSLNNQNCITLHLHLNDCLSLDSQSKLLTSLTLSELSIIGRGEKRVQ